MIQDEAYYDSFYGEIARGEMCVLPPANPGALAVQRLYDSLQEAVELIGKQSARIDELQRRNDALQEALALALVK